MIEQLSCTTCDPAHVLPMLPIRVDGHLIADRITMAAACGSPVRDMFDAIYFLAAAGVLEIPKPGWRFGARQDLPCRACLRTLPVRAVVEAS